MKEIMIEYDDIEKAWRKLLILEGENLINRVGQTWAMKAIEN
jgi:hypothetical protein